MHTLQKAYLEITNRCNLSCSFCPKTRRRLGFLSPEDFGILASRLRPHTQYLYLHLMGEPLLHPQLEEILDRAEGLARFYTSDRAVDFQRLAARFLGEEAAGPVEQVDISQYGE